MVQDWSREALPPRQPWPAHQGRETLQRRYPEAPESNRCMSIENALSTHCGISSKVYFLAVMKDDGTVSTFSTPGRNLDAMEAEFFNRQRYQQLSNNFELDTQLTMPVPEGNAYSRAGYATARYPPSRSRLAGLDDGGDDHSRPTKRPRAVPRAPPEPEEEDQMMRRRRIQIQKSDELWKFYEERFKNSQQSACKLIAKAWIKAVEPKKQSTHPYTGSDEKAPSWWPKPWGSEKEHKVRHKEPDHLYKRERVHLLNHILNLVTEPPEKQHPGLQKLQLDVKKLEECTNEALSGFYAENATNASKKSYINEIFKVAKQQERYKAGAIDGHTEVYVLCTGDRYGDQASENDNSSTSFAREDDDGKPLDSTRVTAAQPYLQTSTAGPSPSSAVMPPGGQMLHELPMRNSHQVPPHNGMHADAGPGVGHSLMDGSVAVNGPTNLGPPASAINVNMIPSAHDASRRSSVYGDYGNGLYQQHWQSFTTSAEGQPMYYTHHANPGAAQGFSQQLPVAQPHPYVANSFDSMSRAGYDGAPPHAGYKYEPNDGRSMQALPGVSEVIDSVPREHL